jgi:hypothetical protein
MVPRSRAVERDAGAACMSLSVWRRDSQKDPKLASRLPAFRTRRIASTSSTLRVTSLPRMVIALL